jgi:hypothetical protein
MWIRKGQYDSWYIIATTLMDKPQKEKSTDFPILLGVGGKPQKQFCLNSFVRVSINTLVI